MDDHTKLTQIDTKLNILITQMNRAAYDDGFPRCATREQRLQALEDTAKNARRIALSGVVAVGLVFLSERVAPWFSQFAKYF